VIVTTGGHHRSTLLATTGQKPWPPPVRSQRPLTHGGVAGRGMMPVMLVLMAADVKWVIVAAWGWAGSRP
jgi:hypothetical protein